MDSCNYNYLQYLKNQNTDMCIEVSKGICNSYEHYLSFLQFYYCYLNESEPRFIYFTILVIVVTLTSLNYLRQQYLVSPILKLRKKLSISNFLSEPLLLPIIYGIVPLTVRVQGAYKNLALTYSLGISLGTMFAISTLMIGLASMVVGQTAKIDKKLFWINTLLVLLSLSIFFVFGLAGSVRFVDGCILIGAWIFYLIGLVFLNQYKLKKKLKQRSKL